VANRVAYGNALLKSTPLHSSADEYRLLRAALAKATTLMSGRHLQHGDRDQPHRGMEIFTNCATSATSFLLFYLLLNGSGIGRCYDDDMMLINWDLAPNVRFVLSQDHPDYDVRVHESVRDARHKYGSGKNVVWLEVPDSREGWRRSLVAVDVCGPLLRRVCAGRRGPARGPDEHQELARQERAQLYHSHPDVIDSIFSEGDPARQPWDGGLRDGDLRDYSAGK
jgi:hypothetical protein